MRAVTDPYLVLDRVLESRHPHNNVVAGLMCRPERVPGRKSKHAKAKCARFSSKTSREAPKYRHQYDIRDVARDRRALEADRDSEGNEPAGADRIGRLRVAGSAALANDRPG